MKTKAIKYIFYTVSIMLGGILSYFNINGIQRKSNKKFVADYIYTGRSKEKLDFEKYDKGLFFSDSTVLKHKEGMLATPKVAGEVAFAIFEDVYSYDEAKFSYPYYITKNVYTWGIGGTCGYARKEGQMLMGCGLSISLQRSNGMVTFLWKTI